MKLYRVMNMKLFGCGLSILGGGLLLSASNVAADDETGWYVGAGFGTIAADYKVRDFDDGSISQGRVDDDDTAWKLYGGYRVNRYLAVEGGYADLHNETDNRRTFTGVSDGTGSNFQSLPNGPVSIDIDNITGFFAAAVATYPLSESFVLNGKAGLVYWEADRTTLDLSPRSTSLDGTDPLIGIGVEYRFHNGIAIRGEAERFFDVGDTDQDVFGLSVQYGF